METSSSTTRAREALREAFEQQLRQGYAQLAAGEFAAAMAAFEAAHILGQAHTWRHLRSHVALLRWGWRTHSPREIAGQLGRLAGAALFTWLWVPRGNPGSTRVGAFTPQPIAEALARLLREAGS
jgi:hypothetical protein